jgi:hypothetical protein
VSGQLTDRIKSWNEVFKAHLLLNRVEVVAESVPDVCESSADDGGVPTVCKASRSARRSGGLYKVQCEHTEETRDTGLGSPRAKR